jgi:hypothetical protein
MIQLLEQVDGLDISFACKTKCHGGSRIFWTTQAWDIYSHGFRPEVYHNGFLDGYRQQRVPKGFNINYWPQNGTTNFPEAVGKCNITTWG